MPKNTSSSNTPPEAVISIIGAGMTMVGDSETDGSLRIEGTIRGSVRAGKSVVVGRDGFVDGSVFTQDAVIAGRVSGGIHAESRLELQATSEVSGEIVAPRMQVEEGAKVQGQVAVGETAFKTPSKAAKPQKVGGGGKAERRSESEQPTGGGKAERQTEQEQASVGGKAERQTEPERPSGGGKADRKPEQERPSGARKGEPETKQRGGGERVIHKGG